MNPPMDISSMPSTVGFVSHPTQFVGTAGR
jgi:hypothetical protein